MSEGDGYYGTQLLASVNEAGCACCSERHRCHSALLQSSCFMNERINHIIFHKIGFGSRILAYINRSFDVREQLPQFYRCINLASMVAV